MRGRANLLSAEAVRRALRMGRKGSGDYTFRGRVDKSDFNDAHVFYDSTGSTCGPPSGNAITGRRVASTPGHW